jgi:hypothetical protein
VRFQQPPEKHARAHRRGTVGLVLVVLIVGGGVVAGCGHQPNPPVAPSPTGGAIALAGWKLSIPEANAKADAASIEPATVNAPWLTRTPDGGLEFWAPTTGATTKNSEHPRTELQSLTNFRAGTERHTLTASLTLLQLPQDGRGIILGQIHGANDISSVPYVMLRVQNNQLRVVVKQVQDGDQLINYPLLDNVGLNSQIDYTITDLGDGTMTFSATSHGTTGQASAPVPAPFRGATVRFQASDYQQANASSGPGDGGRVIFHHLVQQ